MEVTMKSPIVLLLESLLDDFSRLEPCVKGLKRDLQTLKSRFKHEGYSFLAIALPTLAKALDRGLDDGKFTCPRNFKRVPGGAIPRIFSGMLCEVFDPFSGLLKDDANLGVVKNLRMILLHFKKIQMPDESNVLLESKAVSEFFRTDGVARDVSFGSQEDHLLERVSRFVLLTLHSRELDDLDFKHGPGAVREGLSSNQKWLELNKAIGNGDLDTESFGYDDFGFALESYQDSANLIDSSTSSTPSNSASRSTSRLITVPKNSTSRRTITIEPLIKQFVQQGLNAYLRQSIGYCRILRNCLDLTDQSLNQKLALEGSITSDWATLDLKSASDLLSLRLVERVFGHHSKFFGAMLSSRSESIEYDNKVVPLYKFAGMGNALTFPVQSVCFAVVCLAAISEFEGRKPTLQGLVRASRHIRIFGDDIIVRKRYAHKVANWLERVGLKINSDKSFLEGNFRESCGLDAFRGVEVTPIYLKHRPVHGQVTPGAVKSIVETSNHLWLNGYYEASTVLKNFVESELGIALPLVSKRSEALGWHTHLDGMTPNRWNHRLHRLETRSVALKALKRSDRLDGWAALLKFFHVPLLGRPLKHLEQTVQRFKHRFSPCWVPTISW
jgi:hypothetical protein